MSKSRDIIVRVKSQKGECAVGHKEGDEFIVGEMTPLGFCTAAFYTIFPFLFALQHDAVLPWETDHDKAFVACPDPDNPVVFEIIRQRK